MQAQRGSRSIYIYIPILNIGARWLGGRRHAPTALTQEGASAPIIQEAGWTPRPVWVYHSICDISTR